MTLKSLDTKLAEIIADPSSRAFLLADAKDADMAFGVGDGVTGLTVKCRVGHARMPLDLFGLQRLDPAGQFLQFAPLLE